MCHQIELHLTVNRKRHAFSLKIQTKNYGNFVSTPFIFSCRNLFGVNAIFSLHCGIPILCVHAVFVVFERGQQEPTGFSQQDSFIVLSILDTLITAYVGLFVLA